MPGLAPRVAAQTVINGDFTEVNGKTHRLYGTDAPDDGQIRPDGWPAAYEAEAYLGQSIGEKTVTCTPIGLPQGNVTDAICRADGVWVSWPSRKRTRPAAVQPKNSSVIRLNSGSRMAHDQAM